MAAALPFLLSAIFKISAGQLSDRISFCSEKTKVIFFASISQVFFLLPLSSQLSIYPISST